MRDNIDLFEYWCLLAEALDAEELEEYNEVALNAIAFHDPKRLKKWKWQSHDHAGTKNVSQNPAASLMEMVYVATAGDIRPMGNIYEYAQTSGREIVYRTREGTYVNKDGQPIERQPGMLVVPFSEVTH